VPVASGHFGRAIAAMMAINPTTIAIRIAR